MPITVKCTARVPLQAAGTPGSSHIAHAGSTVYLPEDQAIDLAAAGKVVITGTLSPRGSAYQTSLASYAAAQKPTY
jgi:hypothetical protein